MNPSDWLAIILFVLLLDRYWIWTEIGRIRKRLDDHERDGHEDANT